MTKNINLTNGQDANVDDNIFDYLNQWNWYLNDEGYAVRRPYVKNEKKITIRMHRVVTDAPDGTTVDHIDHNRLNNQRDNLRICTDRQNLLNSRRRKDSSSKYKGVALDKRDGKWRAHIQFNKKHHSLGYFTDPIEAAQAYDKKAKELFGEFANTNF